MQPNVDWKQAPKRAHWWAMDANGEANWFLTPSIMSFTDFWFAEQLPAPSFHYTGDWHESLVERPTS